MGFHSSKIKDREVWWLNLQLLLRHPIDGKENKNFSLKLLMFSTVSFVSCICTNFSFYIPANSYPEAFLIDELLELQLRGGQTCAFDGFVVRSKNSY